MCTQESIHLKIYSNNYLNKNKIVYSYTLVNSLCILAGPTWKAVSDFMTDASATPRKPTSVSNRFLTSRKENTRLQPTPKTH